MKSTFLLLRPPSASIIQSWLLFCLASEVLGRDVTHGEFLERCAVGTSKTSIDLQIPLWLWVELKALSTDAYEQKERELNHGCGSVLIILGFRDFDAEEGYTELSLVVLSVHMLLYLNCDIFDSGELPRTSLQSKSTQLLTQRMLKNGWCGK